MRDRERERERERGVTRVDLAKLLRTKFEFGVVASKRDGGADKTMRVGGGHKYIGEWRGRGRTVVGLAFLGGATSAYTLLHIDMLVIVCAHGYYGKKNQFYMYSLKFYNLKNK